MTKQCSELLACFTMAFNEGLQEALANTTDKHLKDLIERRLLVGYYKIMIATLAEQQGKHTCTCPSGDGSLRWPCPQHPVEQAVTPETEFPVPAQGAVYAELPEPTASIGIDDAWHEPAMRDFADRTHSFRLRCKSEQARLATLWGYVRVDATTEQATPKAAPGELSDVEIDDFLDSPACITWMIASNRDRYRLLVRAVLAKWAAPQPAPVAQGDAEDAARYRWLRRWKGQEHEPPFTVQHEIYGTLWGGDLDAAIDADRQAFRVHGRPEPHVTHTLRASHGQAPAEGVEHG